MVIWTHRLKDKNRPHHLETFYFHLSLIFPTKKCPSITKQDDILYIQLQEMTDEHQNKAPMFISPIYKNEDENKKMEAS